MCAKASSLKLEIAKLHKQLAGVPHGSANPRKTPSATPTWRKLAGPHLKHMQQALHLDLGCWQ